jgi:hypothetical protein
VGNRFVMLHLFLSLSAVMSFVNSSKIIAKRVGEGNMWLVVLTKEELT